MKTSKKIKLLVFQNSVAFGGAELQLISLLDGLFKKGVSVTLLTNEDEIIEKLKRSEIKAFKFKFPAKEMSGKWNFLKAIITLPYFLTKIKSFLKKHIKEEGINAVYLPSFNEKVFISKIAKKLKLGVIWKEHGDLSWAYNSKNPFLLKMYKKSSEYADYIISPSSLVRERVLKHSEIDKKISKVVVNGIDFIENKKLKKIKKEGRILREKLVSDDTFIVSFVSRLTYKKGPSVLLEAVKFLKEKGINIFCFFVGNGPFEKEICEKVEELGIKKQIHFFGFLENEKYKVVSASDVFCFPTLHTTEGAPLVVPEALMMGKPVIASDIGGIPEVIRNNEDGLLFKPGDPIDLANKIEYLICNKHLLKKFGENARRTVRKDFNSSVMIEQTLDLFNKSVGNL